MTELNQEVGPKVYASIILQAVLDVREIQKLKDEAYFVARSPQYLGSLLSNFWTAKKYIESRSFEHDCIAIGFSPTKARQVLDKDMKEGRDLYGKWVRRAESVSLVPETEDEEAEPRKSNPLKKEKQKQLLMKELKNDLSLIFDSLTARLGRLQREGENYGLTGTGD